MRESGHIYRNNYTDVNFIKKTMWEKSGKQTKERWTIWGFDGNYLRGVVTVYGTLAIRSEMAKAMVIWQTLGSNHYPCHGVILTSDRMPKKVLLIWANGDLDEPLEIEHNSFNANPGNDRSFMNELRRKVEEIGDAHQRESDEEAGRIS